MAEGKQLCSTETKAPTPVYIESNILNPQEAEAQATE